MSFLNNADDEFQIWEDNHCNLGASSIIFLKMMILMKKKKKFIVLEYFMRVMIHPQHFQITSQ